MRPLSPAGVVKLTGDANSPGGMSVQKRVSAPFVFNGLEAGNPRPRAIPRLEHLGQYFWGFLEPLKVNVRVHEIHFFCKFFCNGNSLFRFGRATEGWPSG
jgi:hypothetical protein